MTYLLAAAAVALLLVAGAAAYLGRRRRVRRAARSVRSTMQALYSGPHSYREVSLGDFPRLDHAFYEERTGDFAALDFSFLGDVEDVTVSRAQIGEPTAMRVMLGEDRRVLAFVHHAELSGKAVRVVELESVFGDGTFVLTSTALAASPMSMPPEIDCEYHPATTPAGALVRAHRARVRGRLAAAGGAPPLEIGSLADAIEHQRHMDEIRARFRKGQPTRVSRDELRRMGGPERFRTATEVAREMERSARQK